MKRVCFLIVIIVFINSCSKDQGIPADQMKAPDHIIFVWFENKGYSNIIGADSSAPFINSLLQAGTSFTNFHSLGHPSYPEYIRFFAATAIDKINDDCIAGRPYVNLNLYTQLNAKNKSFAWYSEDLPFIGSDTCYSNSYVERHNPTQCFYNVPGTANKRWIDFPNDFSLLENVVCISPNLDNDMHDGSILQGDQWLKINCMNLINWCKTHNSLFVIYFDEDQGTSSNNIPLIVLGENVKPGYISNVYYDHYNWTHTILEIYKAEQIENSKFRESITDFWK